MCDVILGGSEKCGTSFRGGSEKCGTSFRGGQRNVWRHLGGGQRFVTLCDRGGGSKIAKNSVTSFMDGPICWLRLSFLAVSYEHALHSIKIIFFVDSYSVFVEVGTTTEFFWSSQVHNNVLPHEPWQGGPIDPPNLGAPPSSLKVTVSNRRPPLICEI